PSMFGGMGARTTVSVGRPARATLARGPAGRPWLAVPCSVDASPALVWASADGGASALRAVMSAAIAGVFSKITHDSRRNFEKRAAAEVRSRGCGAAILPQDALRDFVFSWHR